MFKSRLNQAVVLSVAILSGSTFTTGQEIFEDFTDPNLDDCDPMCWSTLGECWDTTFSVADGNLSLPGSLIVMAEDSTGDFSIRVHTVWSGGFSGLLYASCQTLGYEFRIDPRQVSGFMSVELLGPVIEERTLIPEFDPGEDFLIQLDRLGDGLQLRVWKASDPMPLEPLVEGVDATLTSGLVAIRRGFADILTVRSVRVSDSPINTEAFIRGDGNADGSINIVDPTFIANFIFGIGPATPPPCEAAADANGDGALNIADPSFVARFYFGVDPATPPPAPFPDCGLSLDEPLSCIDYAPCRD